MSMIIDRNKIDILDKFQGANWLIIWKVIFLSRSSGYKNSSKPQRFIRAAPYEACLRQAGPPAEKAIEGDSQIFLDDSYNRPGPIAIYFLKDKINPGVAPMKNNLDLFNAPNEKQLIQLFKQK